MAATPWEATQTILAGGGLEAIGRSYLGSGGGETLRQVVFQMYPALPLGQKNYLVGLAGQFLSAGTAQQGSLFGMPIPISDVPVNPGLGGAQAATDRFRYSTYVGVADANGNDQSAIKVDVYSPIELSTPDIAQAAEQQVSSWAARYPKLAQYLQEHPLPTGVTVIGAQRAY